MPKRPVREPIPSAVRRRVLERDNYRCRSCGSTTRLNIDHIKPVSRGGDNSLKNLQTLCWPCNRAKNVVTYNYLKRRIWRRSDPISRSQKKSHKLAGQSFASAVEKEAKRSSGCCSCVLGAGLLVSITCAVPSAIMVRIR